MNQLEQLANALVVADAKAQNGDARAKEDVIALSSEIKRLQQSSSAPAPQQASVAAPSGMQQFADLRNAPQPNTAQAAARAFMPGVSRDASHEMLAIREKIIDTGLRVGVPAAGILAGPYAPAAIAALAPLGVDLAQRRAMQQGTQKDYNYGETLVAPIMAAAIPGFGPAQSIARTIGRDAMITGAQSTAGTVAQSVLDGQGMPSTGDLASSFGMGAVGGGIGGALRGNAPVPFDMLSEAERLVDQSRINLKNVRKFGAVMEPDLLGQPGIVSSLAESADLVGKAKTANAVASQKAANASLGLEPTVETFRPDKYVDLPEGGTRFEPGTLTDIAGSKSVQEPYNTIRDMRDEALKRISSGKRMTAATAEKMKAMASADVDALRLKRNEMLKAGKLASTSGSPEALSNYSKLSAEAAAMEKNIEAAAIKYGDEGLIGRYRQSRKLISKTHAIDYATDGSGMVDANKLAANPGGFVLSDELGDIANFTDSVNRLRKIKADSGMGFVPSAANLTRILPGGDLAMNVINRLGPNAAARYTLGESAQNALAAGRYTSGPNNLASSLARFSGIAAGQQNGPSPEGGPEGPPAALVRFSMPAVQNVVRGWSPSYDANFGKPGGQ